MHRLPSRDLPRTEPKGAQLKSPVAVLPEDRGLRPTRQRLSLRAEPAKSLSLN